MIEEITMKLRVKFIVLGIKYISSFTSTELACRPLIFSKKYFEKILKTFSLSVIKRSKTKLALTIEINCMLTKMFLRTAEIIFLRYSFKSIQTSLSAFNFMCIQYCFSTTSTGAAWLSTLSHIYSAHFLSFSFVRQFRPKYRNSLFNTNIHSK